MEFAGHATSSSEKKERVGQVEALPLGARARHRSHDPLDAPGGALADVQPAPQGVSDDHEVAHRKTLPQELGIPEQLGEADEILGFGRDDPRVGEDVPPRHEMIEIDGQLERRSGLFIGPAGVSRPQVNPGQAYEADRLRVLGVQRQMLVAMGQVIGLDGAFEVLTRPRQITPPEGAHAEEIPALSPSDRIMTLVVDERLAELAALVETAALQPGEAETAQNRRVHGSVELAAERKGPLVELVRSVGAVAFERHQG